MFEWLRFWRRDNPQPSDSPAEPATPPLNTAVDPPASPPPEVPPARGIADLMERLEHNDPTSRQSAAEALGARGAEAVMALPALLLAAIDVEATVRKAANSALGQIDAHWPAHPSTCSAVSGLAEGLGNRFEEVRQAAAHLLGRVGRVAVPALVRILAEWDDDTTRLMAARTLGKIGPEAASAVPALATGLRGPVHVRQAVAEALVEIGPAAEPAVPALAAALADDFPAVREAAARALGQVGRSAELAIPALVGSLPDRVKEVREAAVAALIQIGAGAVPTLVELLQKRDRLRMQEWLRRKVERSDWVNRLDLENYQREPLKAIRNVEWYFSHSLDEAAQVEAAHEAAARALGGIGPAAAEAVPALVGALPDENRKVRLAAARALGQIGESARDAIPALVRALTDASEPVRQAAAQALPEIDADWASGLEVQEVLGSLVTRLARGGEASQAAVAALALVGRPAVARLVEALATGDRILRENAALTLGRIGAPAEEAVPALVRARKDAHGWVRQAAEEALRRVDPDGAAAREAGAPG